ncbi:MAG: GtrA family protein [Schwartzia sp.]|nr:GtrA family protein [Schwartzia sp. (in: firmicutes)]
MVSEIIRFLIVGGGCFCFEMAMLYGFAEWAGMHYLLASAVAFIIAVIVNYVLCRCWVFRGAKNQSKKSFAIFVGSSVAGLGINQICMYAMVDIVGMWYMFAKVVSAAVVMVWNFIAKKYALTRIK